MSFLDMYPLKLYIYYLGGTCIEMAKYNWEGGYMSWSGQIPLISFQVCANTCAHVLGYL